MKTVKSMSRIALMVAALCGNVFQFSWSSEKTIGAGHKIVKWNYPSGTYSQGGYYSIGKEWAAGYNIYRDLLSFSLDLSSNQLITSAALKLTITPAYQTGTWTKARITNGAGIDPSANPGTTWLGIKNGYALFSDLVYTQMQNISLTSDSLLSLVRVSYNQGKAVQLGILSQVEDSAQSLAHVYAELYITYEQANVVITVENSFGGGYVKVDDSQYPSGSAFNFQNNSTHKLEAVNGQTLTSDGMVTTFYYSNWTKDGVNYSTENPLWITVTADAHYEAKFAGEATLGGTHTVATGQTLAFKSNTTIYCNADSKIMVYGTLLAQGENNRPIIFTCPSGYWQGIEFSGSTGSAMTNCTISYASSPIVATNTGGLLISNSTIDNSYFGYDAAMSFYNSSPQIVSTSINGRGDSWNGIRFAEGTTGYIMYSTIQNCGAGNGIVVQDNSSPFIAWNNIHHNYFNGIFVIGNGSGYPVLKGNTVAYNGWVDGEPYYNGIVVNSAMAELRNNTVTYSNWGVVGWNYGWITSGNSWLDPGQNFILHHNIGILGYYTSYLTLGYTDGYDPMYFYGACNHIYYNTYNAMAGEGSSVLAQGNWWGGNPPDPSKFYTSTGGSICYTNWRTFPEVECLPEYGGGEWRVAPELSESTQPLSVDQLLIAAERAHRSKEYAAAEALYKQVLSTFPNSDKRKNALVGLYFLSMQTKNTALISQVEPYRIESGSIGDVATELTAMMYAAGGQYAKAKQVVNDIKSKHPGTDYEKRALILLATLGGANGSERATSVQAIAELKQKFGSSVGADLLAALGMEKSVAPDVKTVESLGTGESLTSYPNPFNPTTTIGFTLGSTGFVTLKIYDMLGREVAVLVNEQRNAGSHRVTWDASRFSSGIYFSRLEIKGKTLTQKLLLTK